MHFEIIGEIEDLETTAIGKAIHDLSQFRRRYGPGRWRKPKGAASVRLMSGRIRRAEVHWYEAHGIGRIRFKMKRPKKQFAICVWNEGAEDLEVRKVYQLLPDARAAIEEYVRVIDESGEDYLYPADYFVPVELSREAERALSTAPR